MEQILSFVPTNEATASFHHPQSSKTASSMSRDFSFLLCHEGQVDYVLVCPQNVFQDKYGRSLILTALGSIIRGFYCSTTTPHIYLYFQAYKETKFVQRISKLCWYKTTLACFLVVLQWDGNSIEMTELDPEALLFIPVLTVLIHKNASNVYWLNKVSYLQKFISWSSQS